jgi:hypothetical protein
MMTRMVPVLLATGLAVGMGCQAAADTGDAVQAVAADAMVVTLKVPNMT